MMQQLYLDLNRPYQRGEQITFEFEYSPWKIKEDPIRQPSGGIILSPGSYDTRWGTSIVSSPQPTQIMSMDNCVLSIDAKNIVWTHTNKVQKFFLRLLGIQK